MVVVMGCMEEPFSLVHGPLVDTGWLQVNGTTSVKGYISLGTVCLILISIMLFSNMSLLASPLGHGWVRLVCPRRCLDPWGGCVCVSILAAVLESVPCPVASCVPCRA